MITNKKYYLNENRKMIRFTNMETSEIWDKYRKESQQTICIVGVLILAAKLCKNDGHFNIHEEEEILKIIPHNPRQKKILLQTKLTKKMMVILIRFLELKEELPIGLERI